MLPKKGLLLATVGVGMPLQSSRRMMEQGNLAEVVNPLEDTLATTEDPNMGQGNYAEGAKLLAPMEGREMVQKYKGKLSEINHQEDTLRTLRLTAEKWSRILDPKDFSLLTDVSFVWLFDIQERKRKAEAALQRKRRELDDLLRQGTQQYYSAAFAGPERVKDAILKTAVGKRWGPHVATELALMVPAPDPENSAYGQLAEAYLDHLLAHEPPPPNQDYRYRAYLEGKRKRLTAVPRLSSWKRVASYIRGEKLDNSGSV